MGYLGQMGHKGFSLHNKDYTKLAKDPEKLISRSFRDKLLIK